MYDREEDCRCIPGPPPPAHPPERIYFCGDPAVWHFFDHNISPTTCYYSYSLTRIEVMSEGVNVYADADECRCLSPPPPSPFPPPPPQPDVSPPPPTFAAPSSPLPESLLPVVSHVMQPADVEQPDLIGSIVNGAMSAVAAPALKQQAVAARERTTTLAAPLRSFAPFAVLLVGTMLLAWRHARKKALATDNAPTDERGISPDSCTQVQLL